MAINKYREALILRLGDRIVIDGINEAEKLILEKECYDVVGAWECLDAEKRIFLYKDNEHFDSKYQIKDGKLCDLGFSKICSKRKK